jgi:hypothetical protein
MFARAVDSLGPPASIAALPLLSRGLRRELAGWIALMESIVRKLLLAEAAQLPSPRGEGAGGGVKRDAGISSRVPCSANFEQAPLHPASPLAGRGRDAFAMSIDPSLPHTWPAQFSLAPPRDADDPSERRLAAHDRDHPRRPRRTVALRLAMRFEALRRVLDDPAPHALRLARLIARLSQRAADIARRFAIAPALPDFVAPCDPRLVIEVMGRAFAAAMGWPVPVNNSS